MMDRSISRQRTRAHTPRATDYISGLPDVILVYILSFLPFKDCIKTSALSRRWQYLWTKSSRLNIKEVEIIAKLVRSNFYCTICEDIWICSPTCCERHLLKEARRMFAHVVDRTLLLHSGCTLDKFQLTFFYDVYDGLTKKVDMWVRYALASNIKDMELSFFNPGLMQYFDERGPVSTGVNLLLLYELPHNCLVSKILSSLNVNCCKLRASALKVFPSLRRIFLKQVVIIDSSVRVLASKFPVLEDLSLENCVISKQFFLCDEDLMIKRLYVTNCKPNEIPTFEINISTPCLVLLVLHGVYVKLTSIRKATKLVDVTMDIRHLVVSEERVAIASLLSGLRHCRNLTLTPWCIQALPADENLTDQARFQLREVVQLTLQLFLEKDNLPRVACLLRSCPNLKQLTLTLQGNVRAHNMGDFFGNGGPGIWDYDPEHYFQSECLPFPCLESSLKKITVNGFAGRRNEMKVVRFLLRNARVLENISIFYEDAEEYYRGAMGLWRQNGRFHQIFFELLRYQRASARAEVIFSSPRSQYVGHEGYYLLQ